jgi:hypothetical protein
MDKVQKLTQYCKANPYWNCAVEKKGGKTEVIVYPKRIVVLKNPPPLPKPQVIQNDFNSRFLLQIEQVADIYSKSWGIIRELCAEPHLDYRNLWEYFDSALEGEKPEVSIYTLSTKQQAIYYFSRGMLSEIPYYGIQYIIEKNNLKANTRFYIPAKDPVQKAYDFLYRTDENCSTENINPVKNIPQGGKRVESYQMKSSFIFLN